MFQLKYTQKLGLTISIATTVVILLSFALFIALFYQTSTSQVKKSLLSEVTEVVENYIKFENNELVIINRDDLVRDTLRDQLSLIVFTSDGNPIDYFGIFSKENASSIFNDNDKLSNYVNDAIKNNKIITVSLVSREDRNSHILLVSPLRNSNQTIGALALISPMENINVILKNSILLVLLILPISVLSIYFVGQRLGSKALKPVRDLDKQISEINFTNLQSDLKPNGHIEDDAYKLTLEFNEMIKRVREGIEKQKSFISNSSHELRTPLARLQTTVDILKGNKDLKQDISDEIKSISNILTRLSILAKVGKRENHVEVLNVKDVIDQYLKTNSNRRVKNLVNKKFKMNMDISDFNIIIENLVSNALKYSDKDVVISSKTNRLVFSDSGIGIPKQEINKITSPFYRSTVSIKKGIEGTGLGLSIVNEICNEYSFKLNINSKVGKGTVVEILIA